jgi:hypothetical protein
MKPNSVSRQNSATSQHQQQHPPPTLAEASGEAEPAIGDGVSGGGGGSGNGNRYPVIQPNQPINGTMLNRFIEIQAHTDDFERQGIFEGLRIAEEEFEALEKSKCQAEINHKVLTEQTKKEKQDFDNISQPTVQSYFKDKQAHNKAITKEQVIIFVGYFYDFKAYLNQLTFFFAWKEEYLQSLNLLEIATNELKAITEQYDHSKEKLNKYKKEHQRALDLHNEQQNILCNLCPFTFLTLPPSP